MTKGERESGDLFAMMFLNKYDGPPTWMDWLLLRQDVLYHARKSHSRAFILYERMRKMMLVAWLVKKRLEDPTGVYVENMKRFIDAGLGLQIPKTGGGG